MYLTNEYRDRTDDPRLTVLTPKNGWAISVSNGSDRYNGKVTKFSTTSDVCLFSLSRKICAGPWSPIRWKGGRRKGSNFESASLLVLDVDDGRSLEETIDTLEGFRHIVGTTRSHRKSKNGKVCDRYRVVLCLSSVCTDPKAYSFGTRSFIEPFGADPACKDLARFYFPCTDIVSVDNAGMCIRPIEELLSLFNTLQDCQNLTISERRVPTGAISGRIVREMRVGVKPGDRNNAVYRLSAAWMENGKSDEEVYELVMLTPYGCGLDPLSETEIRQIIVNARKYSATRGPE